MQLGTETPGAAHAGATQAPRATAQDRRQWQERFEAFRARGLSIDMTRGKPCAEQLALSDALLDLPGRGDFLSEDGGDARNYYGGPLGLPEARRLFATMLDATPEQVAVGNNSSLALMHDMLAFAVLHGVPGGMLPWSRETDRFLCPAPGYDRHFALCEAFGIEMVPVAMTGRGPDMDAVEALVRDPRVKGMWCVPLYSNPTGETYAPDVVGRLARMRTGAPDFRLFWDKAYAVHHLTEHADSVPSILALSAQAGHADRPLVFGSTSKITFAGAGLGLLAASRANLDWYGAHAGVRSIGPDKLNQLRHVRLQAFAHFQLVVQPEHDRRVDAELLTRALQFLCASRREAVTGSRACMRSDAETAICRSREINVHASGGVLREHRTDCRFIIRMCEHCQQHRCGLGRRTGARDQQRRADERDTQSTHEVFHFVQALRSATVIRCSSRLYPW